MSYIIKNGTVVTASDTYPADVRIRDGKIDSIAQHMVPESDESVIDAAGCYLIPGGIDVHTHLSWNFAHLSTADSFETGSKAAAAGGITSIINFTNHRSGNTLVQDLEEWQKKAAGASVIDYGFHVIVNRYEENMIEEFPALVERGATSIKMFMAYKGVFMVNDKEMYQVMRKAGECGMMTNIHAENGDIIDLKIAQLLAEKKTAPIYHAYSRPSAMESEATNRAIVISQMADAPLYVVHVSTAAATKLIDQARKRGMPVFGETCPQYLALDESSLMLPGFEGGKYVCSPPLRPIEDQDGLWKGLAAGALSTIGSDHSPFQFAEKKELGEHDFSKIPNGVPVIEDLMSVVYDRGVAGGRISMNKYVEITSANPAKLFGMYPQKGAIAIGSDADIAILDPQQSRVLSRETQLQNVDYNLFEGMKVQGVFTHVLSRGELVAQNGKYVGGSGRGQYIHRQKSPAALL